MEEFLKQSKPFVQSITDRVRYHSQQQEAGAHRQASQDHPYHLFLPYMVQSTQRCGILLRRQSKRRIHIRQNSPAGGAVGKMLLDESLGILAEGVVQPEGE